MIAITHSQDACVQAIPICMHANMLESLHCLLVCRLAIQSCLYVCNSRLLVCKHGCKLAWAQQTGFSAFGCRAGGFRLPRRTRARLRSSSWGESPESEAAPAASSRDWPSRPHHTFRSTAKGGPGQGTAQPSACGASPASRRALRPWIAGRVRRTLPPPRAKGACLPTLRAGARCLGSP
jgi:hypothetical protein